MKSIFEEILRICRFFIWKLSLCSRELAKKIIVFDSKGIDQFISKEILDTTKDEKELHPILSEIKIMQLFNKLADLTLFLIPYQEIHNCAAQLAVFELSIMTSIQTNFMSNRIQEIKDKNEPKAEGGLIESYILRLVKPMIGFK